MRAPSFASNASPRIRCVTAHGYPYIGRARGARVHAHSGPPRPDTKWLDYSSAWRGFGGSQRRGDRLSVPGRHQCSGRSRGKLESLGKCAKSSRRPSVCGPGPGSLLGSRGVRARLWCGVQSDVRQVWRRTRAAGHRWWRQAARSLAGRVDDAGGRRGLSVRRASDSCEAGLRRLNGAPHLRPRAGSQGAGAGGKGRGRSSRKALRYQHAQREALPRAFGCRRAAGRSCHEKDSRVRRACERLGRRSCELHVPCDTQAGDTCRTSWPQADARRRGRYQDRGRARHHPQGDGR